MALRNLPVQGYLVSVPPGASKRVLEHTADVSRVVRCGYTGGSPDITLSINAQGARFQEVLPGLQPVASQVPGGTCLLEVTNLGVATCAFRASIAPGTLGLVKTAGTMVLGGGAVSAVPSLPWARLVRVYVAFGSLVAPALLPGESIEVPPGYPVTAGAGGATLAVVSELWV